MDIEVRRQKYTRLAQIESALVDRILKSRSWLPNGKVIDQTDLSARGQALRRCDANKLIAEYSRVLTELEETKLSIPEKTTIAEDLERAEAMPEVIMPVTNEFQFLGNKGRQRLVSQFTESALTEVDSYPQVEGFGQFLDLEWHFREVLNSGTKEPSSYLEYLTNFTKYTDICTARLTEYLAEFYDRTFALGPNTFARDLSLPEASEIDELFCVYCHKRFAKKTVYDAHLKGKKHIRCESAKICLTSLIKALDGVLQSTIANLERKQLLSANERAAELHTDLKQRELEDAFSSDQEDITHEIETKQLVGLDGKPIPRWLYKLQGLGNVYKCEICGPTAKYPGRRTFEQHFHSSRDKRHTEGLKRLGIENSSVFQGISSVQEALNLHKLRKRQANKLKRKFDREVEDNDGNVMSERMYEDLKKQGLI